MSPTPKQTPGAEIKLPLGLGRLRLPKWGTWGLTAIFLVAAGAWTWINYVDPALHPATVDVSIEAALQMEESMKHIAEVAQSEVIVDGGTLVKYFSSDACVAVFRPLGAGFKPYFLIDPLRVMKDGPMMMLGSNEVMGAAIIPVGDSPCQRRCIDPHPGVFYEELNEINDCIVEVYREWEEGCAHVQPYNRCNEVWGPVEWLCCVH
jgi:hypothetical protein